MDKENLATIYIRMVSGEEHTLKKSTYEIDDIIAQIRNQYPRILELEESNLFVKHIEEYIILSY